MKTENLKKAAKVFEGNSFDELWVNPKGEFFSNHNLGLNSVKSADDLKKITRTEALRTNLDQKETLVVEALDGTKLTFRTLKEGDSPVSGDKAKIGNKNADGNFKITEELSYTFEKGVLSEITEG